MGGRLRMDFPRVSILSEVFDGDGSMGAEGCCMTLDAGDLSHDRNTLGQLDQSEIPPIN